MKAKIFKRRNADNKYEDVCYHTGFYRFNESFDGNSSVFKINGIPCLQQDGIRNFIFFTETSLIGNNDVIPVEKY